MADRPTDERGSVLMLMPTAVLIVLVLAAITVDRTMIFADQRRLVTTAQAAADDAAAIGVDTRALRAGRTPRFDTDRADRAIRRIVSLHDDPAHPITVRWRVEGEEIVVELSRTVPRMFTGTVPGTARTTRVTARARARLQMTR